MSDSPQFPQVLEVFLCAGCRGSAAGSRSHRGTGWTAGPLGLVSFDNRVVGRVQENLASRAALYLRNTDMEAAAFEDLSRMKEPDSIT